MFLARLCRAMATQTSQRAHPNPLWMPFLRMIWSPSLASFMAACTERKLLPLRTAEHTIGIFRGAFTVGCTSCLHYAASLVSRYLQIMPCSLARNVSLCSTCMSAR